MDVYEMICECLDSACINEWEENFLHSVIDSLDEYENLTFRQCEKLEEIYDKVCENW